PARLDWASGAGWDGDRRLHLQHVRLIRRERPGPRPGARRDRWRDRAEDRVGPGGRAELQPLLFQGCRAAAGGRLSGDGVVVRHRRERPGTAAVVTLLT